MLPFLLQISVNGCFPIVSGMRLRTSWQQIYHDRYSFLLDEVYTGIDVVEAISVVWEYLQKRKPLPVYMGL